MFGEGASIVDCAGRRRELSIKEAMEEHFNRDVGLELPNFWVATLKPLMKKPHPSGR